MPHGITLHGVFIARVHRIHFTRIYNIHFMSGEKRRLFMSLFTIKIVNYFTFQKSE
jgi:hypothetical protein